MKLFVQAAALVLGVVLMGTTQAGGVYDIIDSATDFARNVTILCTSEAVSDPAVREFCDRAL